MTIRQAQALAAVAICAVAMGICVAPAAARTSSDWPQILPQLQVLPADFDKGWVSKAAANEITQKSAAAQGAPKSWVVIRLEALSGGGPLENRGQTLSSGVLEITNFLGDVSRSDPTGLIQLGGNLDGGVAMISISVPIASGAPVSAVVTIRRFEGPFGRLTQSCPIGQSKCGFEIQVGDTKCVLSAPQPRTATVHCDNVYHETFGDYPAPHDLDVRAMEAGFSNSYDRAFTYDDRLGIYEADGSPWDGAIDWKLDDQPWHSISVSAALTPEKRDQALALFKQGFDLYKSGDLVGASSLVMAGLKIDPANHLAWLTMGQIKHSAAVEGTDGNTDWDKMFARTAFQHTIDLAPDSPEAALAQGYLGSL